MPQNTIPEAEWVAFFNKQYSEEHLFVPPSELGTVGFIRAVEQFVLSKLSNSQNT